MKKGLVIFLITIVSSCSSEYGSSIVGDQLTVYFNSPSEEHIAEQIALYWKNNDLLTGQKQDLKVVESDDGVYVLKIIASEPKENFSIPFEQRKLLIELENDLNEKIADSPVEIVICNNQFKPIYNVD